MRCSISSFCLLLFCFCFYLFKNLLMLNVSFSGRFILHGFLCLRQARRIALCVKGVIQIHFVFRAYWLSISASLISTCPVCCSYLGLGLMSARLAVLGGTEGQTGSYRSLLAARFSFFLLFSICFHLCLLHSFLPHK